MVTGFAATALAVAVIAAFALAGGGVWLLVKRRQRKQGVLMLIAGAVLLGNVMVWTL